MLGTALGRGARGVPTFTRSHVDEIRPRSALRPPAAACSILGGDLLPAQMFRSGGRTRTHNLRINSPMRRSSV